METPHTETVVEKAVNFVKDVFGIEHETAPDVEAKPEYHDTAPEVTAENAMRLNPNAYGASVEELNAEGYVRPVGEPDVDRSGIDEHPRERFVKLNPESGRVEDDE